MLKEQIRNKKVLKSLAFQYMWKVDRVLQKTLNKKFYTQLKPEDQMRLLTWRMWEKKYHVSLEFILKTLIPFWTQVLESQRRRRNINKHAIGVGMASLTGKVSEKVLQKEIAKQFPHGENLLEWRATQQEAYIRLRRAVTQKYRDASAFIKDYQESCLRIRRKTNKVITSGKYIRRPYINNPWCH